MFERFTEKCRRTLVLAQEEARGLGHPFLGTEHVLLGMLRLPETVAGEILVNAGVTAQGVREATAAAIGAGASPRGGPPAMPDAEALHAIGIDLDEVRSAVEEGFGPGALDGTEAAMRSLLGAHRRRDLLRRRRAPAFTPAAKHLLERSLREALQLGHNYIGTEHLLLAAARPQSGLASQVLQRAGLPYDGVKAQVREKLAARRR